MSMDKFPRRQFPIAREMLRAARRTRRVLAEDSYQADEAEAARRDLDEAEAALRAIEEDMSSERPQEKRPRRSLPH
jgi:hypothetical protein